MIAGAYRYAEGSGGITAELETGRLIDRFGAQAVFGRVLGAVEIRRIVAAENVLNIYKARAKSDNWAAWVNNNPREAELLSHAAELADNGE